MQKPRRQMISIGQASKSFFSWFWLSFVLFALSLAGGIAGYHYFGNLAWIDALLNASMILGGMGPVDVVTSVGGKIFASIYAIYSGFFLVAAGGLLLVPVFHQVLHVFHAED